MVKDSKDEASCSICGTVIKTKTGNTSGAREHLMRMHDIAPEDSSTFFDPKSIPKPEEANPDNLKSFVWRYMVKANQEEASCSWARLGWLCGLGQPPRHKPRWPSSAGSATCARSCI